MGRIRCKPLASLAPPHTLPRMLPPVQRPLPVQLRLLLSRGATFAPIVPSCSHFLMLPAFSECVVIH